MGPIKQLDGDAGRERRKIDAHSFAPAVLRPAGSTHRLHIQRVRFTGSHQTPMVQKLPCSRYRNPTFRHRQIRDGDLHSRRSGSQACSCVARHESQGRNRRHPRPIASRRFACSSIGIDDHDACHRRGGASEFSRRSTHALRRSFAGVTPASARTELPAIDVWTPFF